MPTPGDRTPRPWPPAVRQFVEGQQEKAYRRLADGLGLNGDAAAAFNRLNGGLPTAEEVAPRRYKDAIGPGFLSVEEWAQFDDLAAAHYKRCAALQPPTAYETPANYSILSLTMDALRSVWASSPTPEPYLASLPSGDVNARIIPEPTTQAPVIFFEQGLMQFIHDFGVVVAWATPPIPPAVLFDDQALTKLPLSYTMPEVASVSFINLLYAYVVSGTPIATSLPIPKPTPDYEIELGELIVAVEVKQIEPNIDDKKLLEELAKGHAVADYKNMPRARQSILDATKQLRAHAKGRLPGLAVLYDATGGLFGYLDADSIAECLYGPQRIHVAIPEEPAREFRVLGGSHGGHRIATKRHNTTLSAVGVLRTSGSRSSLSIFHNVHAIIPLDPQRFHAEGVRHFVFRSEQPELMPRWVEVT